MSERITAVEAAEYGPLWHASRHIRSSRTLVSALVLASADILSFVITKVLLREDRDVPQLLFASASNTVQQNPLDIFVILAAAFVIIRYMSGDYVKRRLFWDSARNTSLTVLILSVPCFLIVLTLPQQYSLFAEVSSWALLLFAIPMMRQSARIALDRLGLWRVPTALIASGSRVCDIYSALTTTLTLRCDVRWLALDSAEDCIPESMPRLKKLEAGDPQKLAAELLIEGCDQAVVATDDMQSPGFADLIQRLMEAGIAVSFIPSFRRLPLVGVTTSYFFGRDILLFQVRSSLQSLPSRMVKRTFDIFGSLAFLLVLSPVFAFLALRVWLHDGGPVFYAQKRAGRHGEPFPCFKFRTMAVDAERKLERWSLENPELYAEYLKTMKLVDDPRITAPGNWMRKSSLDELPQLFNVLRGEMSLVGPRPVLERELIEHYGTAAQLYRRVRPGLTGLWQIRGRSDTTYEERVVFDEWYILNWSFWYDIIILLQTAWTVLLRKGAY